MLIERLKELGAADDLLAEFIANQELTLHEWWTSCTNPSKMLWLYVRALGDKRKAAIAAAGCVRSSVRRMPPADEELVERSLDLFLRAFEGPGWTVAKRTKLEHVFYSAKRAQRWATEMVDFPLRVVIGELFNAVALCAEFSLEHNRTMAACLAFHVPEAICRHVYASTDSLGEEARARQVMAEAIRRHVGKLEVRL